MATSSATHTTVKVMASWSWGHVVASGLKDIEIFLNRGFDFHIASLLSLKMFRRRTALEKVVSFEFIPTNMLPPHILILSLLIFFLS